MLVLIRIVLKNLVRSCHDGFKIQGVVIDDNSTIQGVVIDDNPMT